MPVDECSTEIAGRDCNVLAISSTYLVFKLLQRKHWRMETPLDVYGSPLAFQQPPFIQVCSIAVADFQHFRGVAD